MNNCQRIEGVFKQLDRSTITHSDLLSALRQTFPTTRDFLIADHYENGKRDGSGNPVGGQRGAVRHAPTNRMVALFRLPREPIDWLMKLNLQKMSLIQSSLRSYRTQSRWQGILTLKIQSSQPFAPTTWICMQQSSEMSTFMQAYRIVSSTPSIRSASGMKVFKTSSEDIAITSTYLRSDLVARSYPVALSNNLSQI